MKGWIKGLLIFAGGLSVGTGAGLAVGYTVAVKSLEKDHNEEIFELREHYDKKISDLEAKLPKKEVAEMNKTKDDDVVTVEHGVPEEKQIDTHKTPYSSYYKKGENDTEYPGKDDEPFPVDVYEITDNVDEYGEPGFGQKHGYSTISMTFYQGDKALVVRDWGEIRDYELEVDDNMIRNDEDEIRNDILPYLHECEFVSENCPYDIIKVRDRLRHLDVEIFRVEGSSLDGEL